MRTSIFPILYPSFWEFYKKQRASFWIPEEVDLFHDKYDNLSDNVSFFIDHILAFFASSDVIVNMNLDLNFSQEFDHILEIKYNYHWQLMMEDIHTHMYANLIDTYIKDDAKKKKLFNAVAEIPCIKKKAEWAMKWIHSRNEVSLGQRLIAFAIVEGIYFSGAFCAIYWLGQQNIMPGLCKSNEFIARDEGMHTEFACMVYKFINEQLDQEIVHNMIKDAVEVENEFITEALPCALLGMNSKLMTQYIKFVADRLVVNLGYESIYNVSNPFSFMEHISLESKNNFFENRTSEYQKASTKTETSDMFNESDNF
jgi:ribonucleoside-diphosphate reductase beta chain